MKPSTNFSGKILSMKYLSEASAQEISDGLKLLTDEYEKWIKEQENRVPSLQQEYHIPARSNLDKCKKTCMRIKKSVDFLTDENVYRAFSLANKAMFEQRKAMLIRTNKFKSDDSICWYPFQLAFLCRKYVLLRILKEKRERM